VELSRSREQDREREEVGERRERDSENPRKAIKENYGYT
jgi:hypothetical protein